MKTFSITLPDKLKSKFDRIVARKGASRTQEMRRLIRFYIFEHEFQARRPHMEAKARELGIKSDEDVFEIVS